MNETNTETAVMKPVEKTDAEPVSKDGSVRCIPEEPRDCGEPEHFLRKRRRRFSSHGFGHIFIRVILGVVIAILLFYLFLIVYDPEPVINFPK